MTGCLLYKKVPEYVALVTYYSSLVRFISVFKLPKFSIVICYYSKLKIFFKKYNLRST